MSPRAAWRLESLGFEEVYDYTAGKQDWLAAGLPIEGDNATVPTGGRLAKTEAPTCRLGERIGDVRERVIAAGWKVCVAVNEEQIVLGLLRQEQLDEDPDRRVEDVMRPGPSTFRPHVPIEEMASFMIEHHLENAPITTSEGKLIGMLMRSDAAAAALDLHAATMEERPRGE